MCASQICFLTLRFVHFLNRSFEIQMFILMASIFIMFYFYILWLFWVLLRNLCLPRGDKYFLYIF